MLKLGNVLFLGEKDLNINPYLKPKLINDLEASDFHVPIQCFYDADVDVIIYEEVLKNGSLSRRIIKNRYGPSVVINGRPLSECDMFSTYDYNVK